MDIRTSDQNNSIYARGLQGRNSKTKSFAFESMCNIVNNGRIKIVHQNMQYVRTKLQKSIGILIMHQIHRCLFPWSVFLAKIKNLDYCVTTWWILNTLTVINITINVSPLPLI